MQATCVARVGGGEIRVLNVASGPGRDMLRFFEGHPALRDRVWFDCVEQDAKAIAHASRVCDQYRDRIDFAHGNALTFATGQRYDLVWSAGLFDYFEDWAFGFMLRRLRALLNPNGELVIGNFSSVNPSRAYMELGEWFLKHRSPVTLEALARRAGFSSDQIAVRSEPTGVNLFLHAGNHMLIAVAP